MSAGDPNKVLGSPAFFITYLEVSMLDVVAGLAGALLSLFFSYVPGAKAWFEKLDGLRKRLVMLFFLAAAVALIIGLGCSGLAADFGLTVTCDRAGMLELVRAFMAAAVVNQTAFLLTPKNEVQ